MANTTPNKGIPYAEPADARGAGAEAMQDLAERVDELLTDLDADRAHRGVAMGTGAPVALANNVWADLPLTWLGGDIPYGAASVTYSGPLRWFLVSFGANVGVNGTQPNGHLRLLFDGSPASEAIHSDNYSNLAGAIPMQLGEGGYETVIIQAKANDGSGGLGGSADNIYLRLATLG